jgi:hypothetical protein
MRKNCIIFDSQFCSYSCAESRLKIDSACPASSPLARCELAPTSGARDQPVPVLILVVLVMCIFTVLKGVPLLVLLVFREESSK